MIELELSELVEVSSVTPAIKANCRSSGAVTLAAMVSALAPGSVAETWMVGKSTCGSGAIGSIGKATTPIASNPAASRHVPIGRRMNGSEMLIAAGGVAALGWGRRRLRRGRCGGHFDAHAGAELQLAVDHDLIAGGQAGFDQRRGAAGDWPRRP